jgi:biotin carboxyl carrier protein
MSKLLVTIDDRDYVVEVQSGPGGTATVLVDGEPVTVRLSSYDGPETVEWAMVGPRPYELALDRDLRWIESSRGRHSVHVRDMEAAVARPVSGDGRIKAPIPGLITRILIKPGQSVEVGDPVLVLEAMKMENEIRAPRSGVVADLRAQQGQVVKLHELLAEIA